METQALMTRLAEAVERGKIDINSPYPPDLKGEEGADELTARALEAGIEPDDVLQNSLITGMSRIGKKFSDGKAFVPEMLMAAKAMKVAMKHIEPFFKSGLVKQKGTLIIGTVQGDLHDIGKNLVSLMIEGTGWKVVDLGVDASFEKFEAALKENPGAVVGLSALLTTTMVNMEGITAKIKESFPDTVVLVGGAPLSMEYCRQIGADFFSSDPQGATRFLDKLVS